MPVSPCIWAALTLYMWANSISKGVSRDRGGGFTVTEMTLELRTVVFLGTSKHQRLSEVWNGSEPALYPSPPSQWGALSHITSHHHANPPASS